MTDNGIMANGSGELRWLWGAVAGLLLVVAGVLGYRVYTLRQAPVEPPAAEKQAVRDEPTVPAPTPAPAPPPKSAAPAQNPPRVAKSQPPQPAKPVTSPPEQVPTPKSEAPAAAPEPPPQPEQPATPPKRPRERVEIFRPDPVETAKPAPAYQGPSAGTLVWSGQIGSNTLVTINGEQVSFGRITGELPGVPVRIELEGDAFTLVDPPNAATGWKRFSLRSQKRLRGAVVIKWSLENSPGR